MEYKFFGWDSPDPEPVDPEWNGIKNQRQLYDLLLDCWSENTCGPMFREEWSEKNPTLGQCTITAFLMQDIFGGEVCGTALPEGIVHCFNVVGGSFIDLTSEQFGRRVLEYTTDDPQSREEHFAVQEKKARYELLKQRLIERLKTE